MDSNTIDAGLMARMFLAGAKDLESKKEWINELNVFPVPDGDTGTNMTMTIMAAAREVSALYDMGDIDMISCVRRFLPGLSEGRGEIRVSSYPSFSGVLRRA